MKKFFNIIRYIFLIIAFIAFVLSVPIFTIYRISHSKFTSSNFWSKIFFSFNLNKLILNNLSDNEKKQILENIDFNRDIRKINQFIKQNIIEKKLDPFLENLIYYLLMKKNTKPLPVSLQREKNNLFYHLNNLLISNSIIFKPKMRNIVEINIKYLHKFFIDSLSFEKFITPELKRNFYEKRLFLKKLDNFNKYTIIIPLILSFLIILFAFKPKKILAWFGFSLLFSSILIFSFSIILIYGLNPSLYFYEQLKGLYDFKAFFNNTIYPYEDFRSVFHSKYLIPILIEGFIYFIISIFFILTSFLLKKRKDKKHDDLIEIIE